MQGYIDRLIRCKYSPDEAYATCRSFYRSMAMGDLENLISSLEADLQETLDVD